jgi:hypothetical protein
MCTVTIVQFNEWPERGAADEAHAGSVLRLVCNRDERFSRHPALRPIARRLGDRRAILPLDEEGGGTWIAATSAGLAMALLNVNDGTAAPAGAPSRGLVIPMLLNAGTLDDAVMMALDLPARRFAPFRLVLTDGGRVVEMRAGSGGFWPVEHDPRRPLLFTSSSLGDALVDGPRRMLFESWFARPDRNLRARQDQFHRHRWTERPHISVAMARDGARTVSRTVVEIDARRVRMQYLGLGDVATGPFTQDLPRDAAADPIRVSAA